MNFLSTPQNRCSPSYRPTLVLNTCGHCGLQTSFPLAFPNSKPAQAQENGCNMTTFSTAKGVLGFCFSHKVTVCVSLRGLESRLFQHGSLVINQLTVHISWFTAFIERLCYVETFSFFDFPFWFKDWFKQTRKTQHQ